MNFAQKYWTRVFSIIFVIISATAIAEVARADIEWHGMYRIEGYSINDPELDTAVAKNKDYGVQTLILRPEFVAADGFYIFSQFNIMNSDSGGNNLGAIFGDGVGSNNGQPGTGTSNSSAISTYEKSEEFVVTEFYLEMKQAFGELFAGRMPINFGLGMSYSDGDGLFDHYIDTRDMVAYKVHVGNIYVMPMFGKVAQGGYLASSAEIEEWDLEAQYNNPDSNSKIGIFYQNRTGSPAGVDTPQYAVSTTAQPATVQPDRMNIKNISVYFKKTEKNYNVGFEACQQSGNFGVDNSAGTNVKLGGFGAVVQYNYEPTATPWGFGLKSGYATGNDPKTDSEYDGFFFNRNYHVAMLLFNQPLGQADILHTALYGRQDVLGNQGSGPSSTPSTAYDADTEALSNVYFLSPSVSRRFGERWRGIATLTGAWLNNTTVVLGNPATSLNYYNVKSDLGYELDLTADYKISKNIMWQNELGVMLPGQAWTVGGQFKADMAYGLLSRAAVSF